MAREMSRPEKKIFADPVTGRDVIQWTNSAAKDQQLFFSAPSVTLDDRTLVFISERDGHPNLHAIDRVSAEIWKISKNESGLLRSYAYPKGGREGFSKVSPCLDPKRHVVYWIERNRILKASLDADEIGSVCELPKDWGTGYMHISSCGRYLCVPCFDQRVFGKADADQWAQIKTVPARMRALGVGSRLYRVDLRDGTLERWAEIPFWVTHVLFHPATPERLLFNKEGVGSDGNPRIWRLEGNGRFSPLFDQPGRMVCSHETWTSGGRTVLYNGWKWGIPFIGERTWEGLLVREIPVPSFTAGHFTATSRPGEYLSDAFEGFVSLCSITDVPSPELADWKLMLCGLFQRRKLKALLPWISKSFCWRLLEGEMNRLMKVKHLCRHGLKSWADQDAHVHPVQTPPGGSAVFTSDREGTSNVYEVSLPAEPAIEGGGAAGG